MKLANLIIHDAHNKRLDSFTREIAVYTAKEIRSAQRFVISEDVHCYSESAQVAGQ
jgi:hypothetical protein